MSHFQPKLETIMTDLKRIEECKQGLLTHYQTQEFKSPIKVEILNNQTDFTVPLMLAIIAIASSIINSTAQFGEDNGGKRLAVMSSLSFSSLLVSYIVRENCLILWVFIIAAVVFGVLGFIGMYHYKKK